MLSFLLAVRMLLVVWSNFLSEHWYEQPFSLTSVLPYKVVQLVVSWDFGELQAERTQSGHVVHGATAVVGSLGSRC